MASIDASLPQRQASGKRPPLWAIGLTALLVATGFGRRATEEQNAEDGSPPQAGRGRSAEWPSEIPVQGWKDILLRVYRRLSRDRIVAIAAGVTFYGLLALFPALAALVSVYGLFADPASVSAHLETMSGFIPGGGLEIIGEQMNRVASQGSDALGVAFIGGLAVSLWSANAGMKAIFDALNVVYDEQEKRGFIRLNAVSLLFTVAVIAFALVAMGTMVVLPYVLGYLGIGSMSEWLVAIGRWPVLLAAVMLVISLMYRYGPSRDEARWRWVTWGSGIAALAWLVASALFAWYAANFGSYNETYGSLGAVIGFMIWMWISAIVVLLGAALDAEMEHQTARDTTQGPAQPLGRRGAVMADTVGETA